MLYRFGNLAVANLTRDSVRAALMRGITAEQIINFLKSHSHPEMMKTVRTRLNLFNLLCFHKPMKKKTTKKLWNMLLSLRKLAIYRSFFCYKNENFHWKKFDIFLIFAQNMDCWYLLESSRRGGSNEYPQSLFWSKNKKNMYTPAYSSFAI